MSFLILPLAHFTRSTRSTVSELLKEPAFASGVVEVRHPRLQHATTHSVLPAAWYLGICVPARTRCFIHVAI